MNMTDMPAKGGVSASGMAVPASGGKKLIITQFVVLLLGALFVWTNFTIELVSWLNKRACTFDCAVGLVNPFLTLCFYGALFFLAAFILSALILKQSRKNV